MREIQANQISEAVAKLCIEANYFINPDILNALENGMKNEQSPLGKDILNQLVENACLAKEKQMSICQDTGMAVVFLEVGQDVHVVGGWLTDAVNQGVRKGYQEGFLRKSVVGHPLERKNTGDNTPAIIHTDIVPGDTLKITVAPKGFGSENMSSIKMLKPADGIEGVKNFILDTVEAAGANPCPPIVVGVGIGGTMEKAAYLAKKALIRPIDQRNEYDDIAELEKEMLVKVNHTGIGPQGLGGNVTSLAVNIEVYPTHIAGLPVAVNINCHATRHAEIEL